MADCKDYVAEHAYWRRGDDEAACAASIYAFNPGDGNVAISLSSESMSLTFSRIPAETAEKLGQALLRVAAASREEVVA